MSAVLNVRFWAKAAPRKAKILETLTLYDLTAKADAGLIKSQ
jgi:hypothetical protein